MVNMSDQYTRITCGGSPMPKDAPVTGLLLGPNSYTIQDADDIPVNTSEAAQKLVELHQAVFPLRRVVGWYKVVVVDGDELADPIAADVQTTQNLANHYGQEDFVMALLQVHRLPEEKKPGIQDNQELPLTLYHCQSNVLVALEWTLKTDPSERVAVERVLRETPKDSTVPPFIRATNEWTTSWHEMLARLRIVEAFLEATHSGRIPWNASLVRRCRGLLLRIGAMAEPTVEKDLTQELAILGRTVLAIHSYSESSQKVQDKPQLISKAVASIL